MKFLHLADLHIGKSVNGYSMLEEQRNAFRQVLAYISEEQPDAVVIAGDIYDRTIPGVEAVRVLDDFLTELNKMGVAVLVISGNHDSPERLNYASRLLSEHKLFIYSAFDGKPQQVTLTDAFGQVNFWLLPFVKPSYVSSLLSETPIESYDDAIRAAIEAVPMDVTQRNVLITHQFYTKSGVHATRSESELSPVGGLDAVDAGLVEQFDYIATGHLHGAQMVGTEHFRYAGSPVKYSFSECRQKKSVSVVELGQKGEFTVRALPLVPIHDMREIKGALDTLLRDDVSSLADKHDYLRVILTDEEEIIDPMGKLKTVYPNVMSLDFENSRTSIDASAISGNADKVKQLSPYELFREFFLDMQGSTMSEAQAEIVRALLETEDGQ